MSNHVTNDEDFDDEDDEDWDDVMAIADYRDKYLNAMTAIARLFDRARRLR